MRKLAVSLGDCPFPGLPDVPGYSLINKYRQ